MFNKKIFYHFSFAIENEIRLDTDVIERIYNTKTSYIPVRPIKSFKFIQKYNINKLVYSMICMLFVLASPIYFFIKLAKNVNKREKRSKINMNENIVLISNGRIEHLYKQVQNKHDTTYININQKVDKHHLSIHNFLFIKDYISAYIYAFVSIFYILFKTKNKTDIMQVYVAYDWFLTYIALDAISKNRHHIYFANHYDRWATMFDVLLKNQKLILLQHGILPKNLVLEYKLRNIETIYVLNNNSIYLFKKLFNCSNTNFKRLKGTLSLAKIKNTENSILIIGQPHSIAKEIEIIDDIQKNLDCKIYIKPHPLYNTREYEKLTHVEIIEDSNFFPRVTVALCYESTLGLEYENSGINVIWWKSLSIKNIYSTIYQIIKEK